MTKEAHILEARAKIGARLLFLRKEKRLTQGEVAQAVGVTNWTIGKIEAGRYSAGIDIIIAYCSVLGRTVESLFL